VKTLRLTFRARERLVVDGSGCETHVSCVSSEWWVVVDVKPLRLAFRAREGL